MIVSLALLIIDRQRYSRNRRLIAWYSDALLRLALSAAGDR